MKNYTILLLTQVTDDENDEDDEDVEDVSASDVTLPTLYCDLCQFRTTQGVELNEHTSTHDSIKKCTDCTFTANTDFAF